MYRVRSKVSIIVVIELPETRDMTRFLWFIVHVVVERDTRNALLVPLSVTVAMSHVLRVEASCVRDSSNRESFLSSRMARPRCSRRICDFPQRICDTSERTTFFVDLRLRRRSATSA